MTRIAIIRASSEGITCETADTIEPLELSNEGAEYVVLVALDDDVAGASRLERVLEWAAQYNATLGTASALQPRLECSLTLDALDALPRHPPRSRQGSSPPFPTGITGRLAEIERAAIVHALQIEANNRTRTARRLGVSRRTLLYKLKKYRLT